MGLPGPKGEAVSHLCCLLMTY